VRAHVDPQPAAERATGAAGDCRLGPVQRPLQRAVHAAEGFPVGIEERLDGGGAGQVSHHRPVAAFIGRLEEPLRVITHSLGRFPVPGGEGVAALLANRIFRARNVWVAAPLLSATRIRLRQPCASGGPRVRPSKLRKAVGSS
jgi:hypothetical protein